MTCRCLAALAAVLVAGAANASTKDFYYAVQDDRWQSVGLLEISASPTVDSMILWIYGSPESDLSFSYMPSQGNPQGSINLEFSGAALKDFQINYFVCNPYFGNCNFAKFWDMDGDSLRGQLTISDYFEGTASYSLLATVPEPSNIALTLAGLTLSGLMLRRRRS